MEAAPLENDPVVGAVRHALFWLLAGNSVGLLLALMLVLPVVGVPLGEATYGRWMPLHLNWQLYGWTALPLVAWVLGFFPECRRRLAPWALMGVRSWSVILGLGGLYWLSGRTSGKIFLDWTGTLRILFPLVILNLWAVLMAAWGLGKKRSIPALVGLLILGCVPYSLYFASDPTVYPPADPSTGGPTGASLLNSTLSVVCLFLLLPRSLGLCRNFSSMEKLLWVLFVGAIILGVFANRLPPSHDHPGQIAALATLVIWPPLIACWYFGLKWSVPSKRWRRALFLWFGLLTLHGIIAYLPGILDQIKFTNALVAHSHLAMAGFTSSFVIFLIQQVIPEHFARTFDHRVSFWTWQAATFLYVVVMTLAGLQEAGSPGFIVSPGATYFVLSSLRLLCGLAMFATSLHWWRTFSHCQ